MLKAFETCTEMEPGDKSVIFFNVTHTGPDIPDAATVTIEAYDEKSKNVFASLAVRLEKPVDAASEIGSDAGTGHPNAIIGWAAAGLGVLPMVLLITSGGEDLVILLSLTVMLLGIAALFLLASYRSRNKDST